MKFDHVTRRRDASGQSQLDSPVGRPSGQFHLFSLFAILLIVPIMWKPMVFNMVKINE